MSRHGTAALATVLAGWLVNTGSVAAEPATVGGEPGGGVVSRPSPELLGGEVKNVSDTCGRPRTLTVQFLGPVSPRLQIPPGASEPVSLARGFYQATIQDPDGVPIESPLVVVEGRGFSWSFGCPPHQDDPVSLTRREDDPPAGARTRKVRLANTTGDCGDPQTVVFIVNGSPVATLPVGAVFEGRLPSDGFRLEVASPADRRRLLIRHVVEVEPGQTLFYGCTDPDFASRKDGVAVVFENATDACPSPLPLTLWVDGRPLVGLVPGRTTTLALPKGPHDFEVREGQSLTRLLQGSRNVQDPFRIRYGCSRKE